MISLSISSPVIKRSGAGLRNVLLFQSANALEKALYNFGNAVGDEMCEKNLVVVGNLVTRTYFPPYCF